MSSFFSTKKHLSIFKIGKVYAISAYLVILITVAIPSTSVAQETEITHESAANEMNAVLHNSIAVLPFKNLSPNPDDAFFAEGIHQEILDHLAKIRDIRPISRPSVLQYKGSDQSLAEIASELNVETLMTGSIRYADNRVNIAVRLIDASNNKQLWSAVYERDLSDIFAVQAEIVGHIVLALEADISAAEQVRIDKVPTRLLEAYAHYLKARTLIQTINPIMPSEFYQHLDQAIAIDPDFALAHAVKACIYELAVGAGYQLNSLTVAEMEEIALEHVKIALALDPNLGMANWAQALIHFNNKRPTETIQTYELTLELRPNDVHILDEYARFLTYLGGDNEKAIRLTYQALDLAPNEALWHARFGKTLMYAGKPADAVDVFRKSIQFSESKYNAHAYLGMVHIILGNHVEGLKELRLADEQLVDRNPPFSLCRLAYFYSRLGYREDAVRLIKRIETLAASGRHIRISILAISYLAIGEADKAYNVLDQNPNEGISSLKIIQSNIMNDPVLNEPRFVALRDRIGI